MSSSSSSYLSSEGAGFSCERPGSGGGEGDMDCVGESPARQRWREFQPSQGSCPLLKAREKLWSPRYTPRTRGDRFSLAKRYPKLHIDKKESHECSGSLNDLRTESSPGSAISEMA